MLRCVEVEEVAAMNFTPAMCDLILAGKKREDWRETCRVREGRSYALKAGRVTRGKITITRIEARVELGSMTLRQAKRSGYKSTSEARQHWCETHKGIYDPLLWVFVISFVVGDATDTPRLLAARPGAPHGDYVDSSARALRGEPEAIPATLQAKYAGEARAARTALQNGSLDQRTRRVLELVQEISVQATEPRVREGFKAAERVIKATQRKIGAA
jgi:hypothetical protein